jgi:hypothetical protein
MARVSTVSPCFRVLPQARQAVAGQGTFVDVARYRGRGVSEFPRVPDTTSTTAGAAPPVVLTPSGGDNGAGAGGGGELGVERTSPAAPPGARRDVCVVAFRGSFDPSRIQGLAGTSRTGKYALVVVGVESRSVRAVYLSDTLPSGLHAH